MGDDSTLAIAQGYGYMTHDEVQKQGLKGTLKLTLGNYNKAYHRSKCGARGKVGPSCDRDTVFFKRPAEADSSRRLMSEVEEEEEMEDEEEEDIEMVFGDDDAN